MAKSEKKEVKSKSAKPKAAAKKSAPKKKVLAKDLEVARASLNGVRISPRKAKLVVDLVKGKQVEPALQILRFSNKKGAALVVKLLESAIANAVDRRTADVDSLWITGGWVNNGKHMKRYMPRAQGRATQILKRSAHITLVLGTK